MFPHKNPREDDYDSSHDHIVAAKKLEPYYKISQLGEICNELIRENTRSIGEYITPDMLDAYLGSASIEQLAYIAEPHFAATKQIMQLREETYSI